MFIKIYQESLKRFTNLLKEPELWIPLVGAAEFEPQESSTHTHRENGLRLISENQNKNKMKKKRVSCEGSKNIN
jgi:hypothetical protein